MFRKIGLLLMVLALFSIAGGHWGVVQSVAWVEMLRDYTQQSGSVTVAVEQTFDGRHPCELCRQIQSARGQAHNKGPVVPCAKEDAKVKAVSTDPILRPADRLAAKMAFSPADPISGSGWVEAPPTPPPRPGEVAA